MILSADKNDEGVHKISKRGEEVPKVLNRVLKDLFNKLCV